VHNYGCHKYLFLTLLPCHISGHLKKFQIITDTQTFVTAAILNDR